MQTETAVRRPSMPGSIRSLSPEKTDQASSTSPAALQRDPEKNAGGRLIAPIFMAIQVEPQQRQSTTKRIRRVTAGERVILRSAQLREERMAPPGSCVVAEARRAGSSQERDCDRAA